jgi:hypothetical protein
MSQNFTALMSFDTIGGMKILAVKSIEVFSNLWTVRYTRLTRRGVKQDAVFLCETPEEAKAKYRELLDVLQHRNGLYIGSKEKRKLKTSKSEKKQPEEPISNHPVPYRERTSSSEHHKEYMKQYYIRKQLGET